jgi:hypothetical protein
MPKLLHPLLACLLLNAGANALAVESLPAAETPAAAVTAPALMAAPASTAKSGKAGKLDSAQMEADLQHLPWPQFRAVIESVPKMKSSVEAYGPIGWQYVRANYTTYAWKQRIDKLDDEQKQRLAERIHLAKSGK